MMAWVLHVLRVPVNYSGERRIRDYQQVIHKDLMFVSEIYPRNIVLKKALASHKPLPTKVICCAEDMM